MSMREFAVKQGVRGFIVQIGCQKAGFSTKEDLLEAITEYVNNPEETEKRYYNGPSVIARVETCGDEEERPTPVLEGRDPR